MDDPVRFAFEAIVGTPPNELQSRALRGVSTPAQFRAALLGEHVFWNAAGNFRLAHEIAALERARQVKPLWLVVGAAGTAFNGWISTNERILNLLNPDQWSIWIDEGSVSAILAEHVWEHLSEDEGLIAAQTCYRFLASGGRLRLAVPDAFKPDTAYLELCRVGGPDGHKVFYDYQSLSRLLTTVGFSVRLLEYWDETGTFHEREWRAEDAPIGRCRRFDPRNNGGQELNYTSLVVDGIKSA